MPRLSGSRFSSPVLWALIGMSALAAWLCLGVTPHIANITAGSKITRQPTGAPQLVSIEPLPEMDGSECVWAPASAPSSLTSAWQQISEDTSPPAASIREQAAQRAPVRMIHDPYPSFSSIAVDAKNGDIVMTDENLFQILVYDRLTNTPARATMSEPRRVIAGLKTKIEFQCGVYVDPDSGDVYAVNNDTVDTLVVFSRNAKGNVPPDRELRTPHGTFGIAVDEERKEIFLTIQHSNAMVVYEKTAQGEDAPLRIVQGNSTRLADPHGVAIDKKRDEIFISNFGSVRDFRRPGRQGGSGEERNMPATQSVPGSGRVVPSSINVYPIGADGDTPPVRVITGPNTQLNWPTGLAMDEARNELYVANDMGDSVLVFRTDAEGDATPLRVLKGPHTGIKNPTGVNIDAKNGELLVANFGNHSATIYKLPAGGDTAPLRRIRSGPVEQPALMIGNPGALTYDSKREALIVPN